MKVVHINTYDSGGAFVAAYRFHKELKNQGVDSNFLVLKKYNDDDDVEEFITSGRGLLIKVKESLKYRLLKVIVRFLQRKISPKNGLISLPYSPYNINSHKLVKEADIIHLHYVSQFIDYPSFFDSFVNKPIFWTLHDNNPFRGYLHYYFSDEKIPFDTIIQKLKSKYLKRSKVIFISPSDWMARNFDAISSLSDTRNFKIHNGIDIHLYNSHIEVSDRKEVIIGYNSFSLKEFRKGYLYLIESIKKTLFNLKTEFVFIGEKPETDLMLNEKSPNLETTYTGFIKSDINLAKVYCNMDFFVITSIVDNLPNVVIEAMACGNPIVAFDVGGISDMVIDGKTGFLVKPYDVDNLSHKIQALIENKSLRKKMGDEARKLVLEKFDIEVQAAKYKNIYEDAFKGNL